MRGHEQGVSLIEILAATFLISIAIIPMLQLYPTTLGANRETEYDLLLSTVALRRMEENINLLRGSAKPVEFDAFVTRGSSGAQSSTCTSMTIASTANYLVIQVGIRGTTAVSSVRVSSPGGACNTGSTASLLRARTYTASSRRSEVWGLLTPPTGTVNVQVNMSASIRHSWVAASFRNVLTATPTGGSGDGAGDSPTQPIVAVSPRTSDSLLVGGFFWEAPTPTITQGPGQTDIGTASTSGTSRISTHLARETNPGDAGDDLIWVVTSGDQTWVALAVELRGQAAVADPNGSATCTDLPNCFLTWTTTVELSSTTSGVGSLKTLNVTACEDTNGNSVCDAGERQVHYDAKITTRP